MSERGGMEVEFREQNEAAPGYTVVAEYAHLGGVPQVGDTVERRGNSWIVTGVHWDLDSAPARAIVVMR